MSSDQHQQDIRRAILQKIIKEMFADDRKAFARRIKRSRNQISNWINGTAIIGDGLVRHIEITLELHQGYMDGLPPPNILIKGSKDRLKVGIFRDVPLRGAVRWKGSGRWEMNKKENGGFVRYPSDGETAYAFRYDDDKLRPRAKPGDFFVAKTNVAPRPGNDVIIYFKAGEIALAELRYFQGDNVCLGSMVGGAEVFTISMETVEFIHRIIATVDHDQFYETNE
jgi:hypothetical protein